MTLIQKMKKVKMAKGKLFLSTTATAALLLTSPLANSSLLEDLTAPLLTDFLITPGNYDVTTGAATGTVRFAGTDDLSGILYASFWLQDADGQTIVGTSAGRVEGTGMDGIYESTFTIPQYAQGGEYTASVSLSDSVYNTNYFYADDIAALGFDPFVQVGRAQSVPEPGTMHLFAVALLAVATLRRARSREG